MRRELLKVIMIVLVALPLAGPALAASVNLSWTAPGLNNDGSALSGVAGYKVYCGTASHTYTRAIDTVTNRITVTGLPDGQRNYFTVTAYTTAQVEGDRAPELIYDAPALGSFYADLDHDGYGAGSARLAVAAPAGYVATDGDCNDNNAAVHPGAEELLNGLDDNCNGQVDEGLAGFGAVLDFDGDAITDIGVFAPAAARWWISSSADGRDIVTTYGWSEAVPVPADYDGDLVTDYAFFWPANGHWYITPSSSGIIRDVAFGNTKAIPVPADYDGDGKADLATYTPSRGEWAFQLSGGGTKAVVKLGGAGKLPVPADYDGDGKTEPAVYAYEQFTWEIIKSSNGAKRSVYFGATKALPAQADFDGDGKADPAFYVPATGRWKVIMSTTGAIAQWTLATGGMPVPGDYDGDGWADAVVFKKLTGAWTIHLANGSMWTQTWGKGLQAVGAQYQAFVQMYVTRVRQLK